MQRPANSVSGWSHVTQSDSLGHSSDSANSTMSEHGQDLVTIFEKDEGDPTADPQKGCLREVPNFLNSVMHDIAALETRISQTTQKAMSVNLEQTLIALTEYNLVKKMHLEAIAKELDYIVDRTHTEVPAAGRKKDSNSNFHNGQFSNSGSGVYETPAESVIQERKKSRTLFNTGNPNIVSFAVQRPPSAFDVESAFSSVVPCELIEKVENIEKRLEQMMETLNIRHNQLNGNRSLFHTLAADPMSKTMVRESAKSFREQLENCENTEEIEALCTTNNIENVLLKMKQFPYDRDIQRDCVRSLRTMGVSEPACEKIVKADCLEHLSTLFHFLKPEQETLMEDIIHIFFIVSRYPNLEKYLQKDKYVELLLTSTESTYFKELEIICMDALCNLLINASNTKWNLHMTRQVLEKKMKKGMEKWTFNGITLSYQLTTFANHLERIKSNSSAISHFSLWLIVHYTVAGRQEYIQLIRDEGGEKVLLQVILSKKCSQMVELAEIALAKLHNM